MCIHVYVWRCLRRPTCQHPEDGVASLRRAGSLSLSPLSLSSLSRSLCVCLRVLCVMLCVCVCVVVVVVCVCGVVVEEEGKRLIEPSHS